MNPREREGETKRNRYERCAALTDKVYTINNDETSRVLTFVIQKAGVRVADSTHEIEEPNRSDESEKWKVFTKLRLISCFALIVCDFQLVGLIDCALLLRFKTSQVTMWRKHRVSERSDSHWISFPCRLERADWRRRCFWPTFSLFRM